MITIEAFDDTSIWPVRPRLAHAVGWFACRLVPAPRDREQYRRHVAWVPQRSNRQSAQEQDIAANEAAAPTLDEFDLDRPALDQNERIPPQLHQSRRDQVPVRVVEQRLFIVG